MSEHREGMPPVEQVKDWSAIAQELDELQKKENDGRGVSCVRGIVASLHTGDVVSARAEFQLDTDKIRNYPEIDAFLEEVLGNA